jgi:4-hydroxyphenylpyruvate dioxygenase-like putative hemolysin
MPIDIKFGEAGAAIPCSACKGLDNRGFFVVFQGRVLLICIKCTVRAIDAYQQQHPTEKIFDVDVDVDDAAYQSAADAVRGKKPDLSESEALEIAKAAIRAIG